jgi:general secretion pathway protein I
MSARRMRGFTLVEVIIAFAILGMSLAVLYGAFASSLARMRHDARVSEATLLAQSLLSRAGTELALSDDTVRGDWRAYSYQLRQELLTAPDGQPPYSQPVERVTATVTWAGNVGLQTITLSTLKLSSRGRP